MKKKAEKMTKEMEEQAFAEESGETVTAPAEPEERILELEKEM